MFVAAMTMMPSFCSNPSISVRSWFSVFRDCVSNALRLVPTASISSMKMMHGIFFFARLEELPNALGVYSPRRRTSPQTPTRRGRKTAPRLARHRARQQRLSRARRPAQQHALGQFSPEPGEQLRVLQVLHNLLELLLRLVAPLDVVERLDGLGRQLVLVVLLRIERGLALDFSPSPGVGELFPIPGNLRGVAGE